MKKKKIIIYSSIIVLIVLTIILFTTYAFITTKVSGNSSGKKYQAISKIIRIEYSDGKETLSSNINDTFTPGSVITKTFTVTNTGDDEIDYTIYLENVTNTFTRYNDITYELYDSSNTKIYEGIFPKTDNVISDTYKLKKNESTTYTLKVIYNNSEENQIVDSGKKIDAKISFADKVTFKNIILTSANNGKGDRTIYQETPVSSPGNKTNAKTERTLSKTQDDFGNSYYYRGNIIDNYVNFAGMCWRIVRIQGDGSVKLILEDQNTTCNSSSYTGNWNIGNDNDNFGYDSSAYSGIHIINFLNPVTNASSSLVNNFKTFQTGVLTTKIKNIYNKEMNDYLKTGDWCYDDTAYASDTSTSGTKLTEQQKIDYYNGTTSGDFYYDSYIRLFGQNANTPTNKCNGTILDKYNDNTDIYVATLTADEIVYAGYTTVGDIADNCYLYDDNFGGCLWTLSPCDFLGGYFSEILYIDNGTLSCTGLSPELSGINISTRPAIQLKSTIGISGGDGTQSNPYVVR